MTITEDIHYYTNTFAVSDHAVSIDRVYLFDEDAFTADHWKTLDEIYRSLPRYRCSGSYAVSYWFGIEGKDPYYLWVSAEPPGFQFVGELLRSDFEEWEAKFHSKISVLPFKRL